MSDFELAAPQPRHKKTGNQAYLPAHIRKHNLAKRLSTLIADQRKLKRALESEDNSKATDAIYLKALVAVESEMAEISAELCYL